VAKIFSAACPHCDNLNNIWNNAEALKAQCGLCEKDMFVGRPIDVDAARFAKHVASGQIPVMAMFWLPPARGLGSGRDIDLPRYAARFEPRIRFLKVNVEDNQGLAATHKVTAAPTLVFFRDGRFAGKQVGKPYREPDPRAPPRPEPLIEWLQELLGAPAA
jgi:thioredoxin 2